MGTKGNFILPSCARTHTTQHHVKGKKRHQGESKEVMRTQGERGGQIEGVKCPMSGNLKRREKGNLCAKPDLMSAFEGKKLLTKLKNKKNPYAAAPGLKPSACRAPERPSDPRTAV